ncbi:MAG: PleD family two-component system response regulator [Kofleriaceae bacterium]
MRTVLIADDVDADRRFIAARASRMGLGVELATSGKEALERAQLVVPAVLVIGTEIGGLRVCSTLRATHSTQSIHTVLMTPQEQLTTTKSWGSKHGVHEYLCKPLGEREVNEIFRQFAESRVESASMMDSGPVNAGGGAMDSRVMREVGNALARHMTQPVDTVMKLFISPELRKLGSPVESLTATEYDALLQRLANRIISLDGKSRNAFLDEARKIR